MLPEKNGTSPLVGCILLLTDWQKKASFFIPAFNLTEVTMHLTTVITYSFAYLPPHDKPILTYKIRF